MGISEENMTQVHPTAVVSPGAELAPGVSVGAYSIIGDHVIIGSDTTVGPHVIIEGHTRIGKKNYIFPFACIGTPPQDIGYRGEDTRVTIGDENVIREYVTIHRATTKENRVTVVGSYNYIMAYCHIAHDCVLGDHIIMANGVTFGGHTHVGDSANFGGIVAVQPFVRIGTHAYIGGLSGIVQDIPPFMIAAGSRAKLFGVNQKGLIRDGFTPETIDGLKRAYRIIWRENRIFTEGVQQARQEIAPFPELETLLAFFEGSRSGILK